MFFVTDAESAEYLFVPFFKETHHCKALKYTYFHILFLEFNANNNK